MIISSKNQNDFNSYLLEIIKASVKHAEDNNNICLTEYFPQTNFNYIDRISSKKFYNIKINMLDFSESDTFFTSQFIKEIQGILYSPSNFLKLSKNPRLLFQTQLNNLCLREFEWKTFNKKLVRTAKLDEFTQHFEKEFLIFLKEIKKYMFPVENISTRKAKLYFIYKFKNFIKYILLKLLDTKEFDVLKPLIELSDDDFNIIARDYISIHWLFSDILKILLKQGHDNLFFYNKTQKTNLMYKENSLIVKNSSLQYTFQFVLGMSLINSTLNYCVEKKKINIKLEELSKPIFQYLTFEKNNYAILSKDENGWGLHCDNANTILLIFENCNVYQGIIYTNSNQSNNVKTEKNYVLPHMLELNALRPLKLPYITEPPKLKLQDIDLLIKPVMFGSFYVSKSENLLKSLNLSRLKKFRISDSFIYLLENFIKPLPNMSKTLIFFLEKFPLDLGFPTVLDIQKHLLNIENYKLHYFSSNVHLHIASKIQHIILGNTGINLTDFSTFLSISELNHIYSLIYNQQNLEETVHKDKLLDLKYARTSITLSKILKNYPIYITDILCVRLRLYPNEHWISRTSGILKHLLCEFKEIKLTIKGLVSLFRAYYAPNENLTNKLENFILEHKILINTKTSKNLLFKFFHQNYLDYTQINHTLYFMNLHIELLKIEKTNKSSINIEIDQTASSVVFLSLLLKDKKMAKAANLLSKKKTCPYIFVMNHFKNFAEKHMENKESNVINFLSSNRKIHKYAFMCFAYNQKYYGRIDDFKQFWIDEFKRLPNKEEYKTLSEFAKNYESFLDNVFPNCCKKLKLLEDLVDLMINDSGFVEILTLEGDVLRWSFLKSEHKTRTKYDPINKKSIKYTINAICEKKLPDKLAHKRRFLSYVIHSIDAAVMRYYIRKMHEKKNYIINHLHDCVILHPNFVDDFYEIVEELYKSDKLYNIIDNLIFEQMRTSLSITSRLKLDEIKAKYILLCDDFKNEINFESKNIYKFET